MALCSASSVVVHALSKLGQKPPELDDVEDDERIHEENEDENGEPFAPGESDVWALHANDVAQDEGGYPTNEPPNEDEPPSTRTT